jgi:hypothetical protein
MFEQAIKNNQEDVKVVSNAFGTYTAGDNAVLKDVVCQDQRSPEYKIIDWSVKALTTKGQQNPDGLHLIEGRGFDSRGETGWRLVVKNATPRCYLAEETSWRIYC